MIESKGQVLGDFRAKAQAFLAQPNVGTGIEFDDATVTLKRYVLSVMHDEQLGSLLARFQKLIRKLDVDALSGLVAEVEAKLSD